MLKSIESIVGAGVLNGFTGAASQLPPFAKKNLIYGWNASGKTTLSRLFSQMDEKSSPELPSGAYAKWRNQQGELLDSRVEADKSTLSVKVFNRDFIDQNLSDHTKAPSLFIVGEANIKLSERIGQLNGRRARLMPLYRAADKTLQDTTRVYERLATEQAALCATALGIRNFRAPDIKALASELSDPGSMVLDGEALEASVTAARDRETYPALSIDISSRPALLRTADLQDVLLSCPQQQAIKRLTDDPNLSRWVHEGLHFHQDKTACAFCGGDARDALAAYAKHYSSEYNRQRASLMGLERRLGVPVWAPQVPDEHRWFPSLRERLKGLSARLSGWVEAEDSLRKQWREQVIAKLNAMDRPVVAVEAHSRDGGLTTILEDLEHLAAEQRKLVSDQGKAQRDASEKVKQHFAACYVTADENIARRKERDDAVNHKNRVEHVGRKVRAQIEDAQRQLQRSSVAASELNALLSKVLGGRVLAKEATDSQLLFLRGEQPAKNLSEGEKTAISFCYFLVSLRQGGSKVSETIVFVDDPISSLDSNHVHQVSSLLLSNLEDAHQLFVSTHSSELFNAIKQKWVKSGKFVGQAQGYLLHRLTEANSELRALPPHLVKFKSDYHHVFYCLAKLRDSQSVDIETYVSTPNLLRRFLEMYTGSRLPAPRGYSEKMHLLFDDADVGDAICRYTDEGSHSQTSLRILEFSDFPSQSKAFVAQVLEALERKDPMHFGALREATLQES